jgi:hypothetical protein
MHENKVLRKFVIKKIKKRNHEELHNFNSPPNIVTAIKSRWVK